MEKFFTTYLTDYKIIKKLANGSISQVFLAEQLSTGNKIAVKIIKPEYVSKQMDDFIRFQNETKTIASLEHRNIVKVFQTGREENVNFIMMEYLDGVSLHQYIQKNKITKYQQATEIMLQIARALEFIHQKGIIHRDLKPHNVILTFPSNFPEVKLIDFGLAHLMEYARMEDPLTIVGTFSYMAPEQSGMLKEPTDERSDLYSLGIIAYQMLTGELPFVGDTVTAILHQQATKQPTSLLEINPMHPPILEKIIFKLLNINPADRYQSARALISDLKKIKEGNLTFTPGKEDTRRELSYRTKLIGREQEIDQLKRQFEVAAQGKGAFCLISGMAGSGKSRLLNDLKNYAYEQGGECISGAYNPKEQSRPLQAFHEALEQIIEKFEQSDRPDKHHLSDKLKRDLGDQSEVLYRFNPHMRTLLGGIPPRDDTPFEQYAQRLTTTLGNLFLSLGQPGAPLVILLDNLQWADIYSINLISAMLPSLHQASVLLIGAFRSNELSSISPLQQLIDSATNAIKLLPLQNLDQNASTLLIKEIFGVNLPDQNRLIDILYQKSKGNPYFIIELIKQLNQEGLLSLTDTGWSIEWDKIKALEVSSILLETLRKSIDFLEPRHVQILTVAAVIGIRFPMELLYDTLEFDRYTIDSCIEHCLNLNILQADALKGFISFTHSNIKNLFYQKLSESDTLTYHQKLAQIIEITDIFPNETRVFELAYHWSKLNAPTQIIKYVLPAAQKAQEHYAYEQASTYFTLVRKAAFDAQFKTNKEWRQASYGLMETCLSTGQFDKAIKIGQELLDIPLSKLEKAKLYRHIGTAYFKKGQWRNSEENLADGLKILGINIPINKANLTREHFSSQLIHKTHQLRRKQYLKKQKKIKTTDLEIMKLFAELTSMYFLSDVNKFSLNAINMLNQAESRLPATKELGVVHGVFGLMCLLRQRFDMATQFQLSGLKIKQTSNDAWGVAQSYQWLGLCHLWKGNYADSKINFNRSVADFEKIDDKWELAMTLGGLADTYLQMADYPNAQDVLLKQLDISKKINNYFGISFSQAKLGLLLCQTSEYEKAISLLVETIPIATAQKIWLTACIAYTQLAECYIYEKLYAKAIKNILEAKKLYETNVLVPEWTANLYTTLATAYICQVEDDAPSLRESELKKKLPAIQTACKQAVQHTQNLPNHHGVALCMLAKYEALAGHPGKADKYFQKSIELTQKINKTHDLMRCHYEYAKFLLTQNNEKAREHTQTAYHLAQKIDAKTYEHLCAELLDIDRNLTKSSQSRLNEKIELQSVINVSQQLSSILELDMLLENILDISLELTRAEQGYIFLYDEKNLLKLYFARYSDKRTGQLEFKGTYRIIKQVEKSRKPAIIDDAVSQEDLKEQKSVILNNIHSVACLPLIAKDKLIGVVYLDNNQLANFFDADKATILSILLNQAAISIDNARLHDRLERHANELEIKVKERTIELEEKNLTLENQKGELHNAYTQLKQQEMALIQQEKLAILGDITASVAHEINSPLMASTFGLNHIKDFTNKLLNEKVQTASVEEKDRYIKEKEEYQTDMDFIEQALDQIRQQVVNMKSFIKFQDNKDKFDVNEELETTLSILNFKLLANMVVEKTFLDNIPPIYGNAARINQVFMIIIKNSIEARDPQKQGVLTLTTDYDDQYVLIKIQDNGKGIKPELQDKLFNESFSTKHMASGMSLSISKEIIEEQGGKIEIQSTEDVGTTVLIKLSRRTRSAPI